MVSNEINIYNKALKEMQGICNLTVTHKKLIENFMITHTKSTLLPQSESICMFALTIDKKFCVK